MAPLFAVLRRLDWSGLIREVIYQDAAETEALHRASGASAAVFRAFQQFVGTIALAPDKFTYSRRQIKIRHRALD